MYQHKTQILNDIGLELNICLSLEDMEYERLVKLSPIIASLQCLAAAGEHFFSSLKYTRSRKDVSSKSSSMFPMMQYALI